MNDRILPVRSGTVPILSSLAVELVETIDDPDRSYEHVWDVIKRMACEMRDRQSLILVDKEADALVHEDEMADGSMFQLLHTIHPRVLRAVCMGTVALEFHDRMSDLWAHVQDEHGPGAYAVGIAIEDRHGKFLTPNEIRDLIGVLKSYVAGIEAWVAKAEVDAYGESQLSDQQVSDLEFAMEIDNVYLRTGTATPTPEMQAAIASEDEEDGEPTETDTVPETVEEESQEMHCPRFASGGQRGVVADDEPQIQSPLIVGNSNDLQNRKQDYRPNVRRLHNAAHIYSLLMSSIKYMGLDPLEVFVPFTKAWEVHQINQGEVLGTIVGSSLVPMAGLNVYRPGGKHEKRPPTQAVLERTRREVNRREWFLDNMRQTCAKSEKGQLREIDEKIFSVTNEGFETRSSDAELSRDSFSAAILESEKALKEKQTELQEAKTLLDLEKAWNKKASSLEDELFGDDF
ncbi:uncharacterized protein PG986_013068 [Apiospora aurea]|uniref:Uncharacterized protein n=1 Tax=Apiospora aurea TaxID=335848 RepID=A0ABR1Q201_9PEZI